MNLDNLHPDYTLLEPIRTKSADLCGGSFAVKAKREAYLLRTKNELDPDYNRRLALAVYEAWPYRPVVARQALLWGKPPVRNLPPELAPIAEDMDNAKQGTGADEFFTGATEQSQIDGLAWVFVNRTPLPPDVELETRDQEIKAGVRPFFTLIPAAQVLDWSFGPGGKLDWLVFAEDREPGDRGPGEAYTAEPTRTVFLGNGQWTRYHKTETTLAGGMKKSDWTKMDEGDTGLGAVPFVPFYGLYERPGLGWPTSMDILDHAVSLYNKHSDGDMAEFLTTNPIPWVADKGDIESLSTTYGRGIKLSPNGTCGYMEPNCAGITSGRASEDKLIQRMIELAEFQAKRDTAQVQSDKSLKQERYIFSSSLGAVSGRYEASEIACWNLALSWMHAVPVTLPPGSVEYNRTFSDKEISEAFARLLSDMADRNQITKGTVLDTLQGTGLMPEDFDPKKELTLLEAEEERRSAFMAFPGVPMPPTNKPPTEPPPEEDIEKEPEQ